MSQTDVNYKTQRAMSGSKKGADIMSDILMKHRKKTLPSQVYFKENMGKVVVDYDKALKWMTDH